MEIINLGVTDYLYGIEVQDKILYKKFVKKEHPDTLILYSPYPVITVGKTGDRRNILAQASVLKENKINVYEVNRGGDVTIHYPGQVLAYFIINLERYKKDIHWYLDELDNIGIEVLRLYGIDALRNPKGRGLWVNDKKIMFVGIGIRYWVTFYGIALNVYNGDMYFSFVNSCGIKGCKVTSISEEKNLYDDLRNDVCDKLIKVVNTKFM